MSTYALSTFTTFIRRLLALNLPEALWIKAELAQVSHSRGHAFLTLIEKSEESEEIVAQMDAVIWSSQFRKIVRERGQQVSQLLQPGLEIRLRVSADFHDRYGFKLTVEDIDPVHTMGKLAQQRQLTLQRLEAKGCLKKQEELAFPLLPQRIAVVSSETAAGYADFRQQLRRNPHHYHYEIELFPASMQGEAAPREIAAALRKIERRKAYYDIIVIIRGGGSRMDLIAFDDEALCETVANAPLPVLSGIGHETDEVLLDYVAHGSLKTPTAVAAFLLEYTASLETRVLNLAAEIQRHGLQQTRAEARHLYQSATQLKYLQQTKLREAHSKLEQLASNLPLLGKQIIRLQEQQLEKQAAELSALDPIQILQRGYAILSAGGKTIRSVEEIQEHQTVTARLADGTVELKNPS